ncbi:nuclear transport factor 2 family protein [Sphingomonas zeae]
MSENVKGIGRTGYGAEMQQLALYLFKRSGAVMTNEVASAFAEDLRFEIQGDVGALPWIGQKTGRQAMTDFLRDLRALTDPLSFEVYDILASDTRAVVLGSLRSRITATGKITASQFALVFTVADGAIVRFQMLEDSYDVSRAAR